MQRVENQRNKNLVLLPPTPSIAMCCMAWHVSRLSGSPVMMNQKRKAFVMRRRTL